MPDLGDVAAAVKKLGEAKIALGGFLHEALDTYLEALPRGLIAVSRN